MSLGLILLIALVVLLFGGYSFRGQYGHGAYGLPGVLLILVIILLLTGHL